MCARSEAQAKGTAATQELYVGEVQDIWHWSWHDAISTHAIGQTISHGQAPTQGIGKHTSFLVAS